MLNYAGVAGDGWTVRLHYGRATANWLIDVIDGASSYLAVGIGMEHIGPLL